MINTFLVIKFYFFLLRHSASSFVFDTFLEVGPSYFFLPRSLHIIETFVPSCCLFSFVPLSLFASSSGKGETYGQRHIPRHPSRALTSGQQQ